MKPIFKMESLFWSGIAFLAIISSCQDKKTDVFSDYAKTDHTNGLVGYKAAPQASDAFQAYWYNGEAELSSYKLEQARYGEIHEGHAVLVYVTEHFLKQEQVKSDGENAMNIPVLKLNTTKKFNTGVYPYSIMQSTFYPILNNQHALKVSCSVQEWCGHVYMQINNRKDYEVNSHSYFEGEADQQFSLAKAYMENEIWTQLRIDPKTLAVGNLDIIPSLEFLRLRHQPLQAYPAVAELKVGHYSLYYPDLERRLSIRFNPEFPYTIESWEEQYKSGFGAQAKLMTSKATKLKTLKSAYWQKNRTIDQDLRTRLQLN